MLSQSDPKLEIDVPLPIDIAPPELEIAFAGEHENEKKVAILDGDVFFNVVARDNTEVEALKVIAPQIEKSDHDNVFGPITTNHVQNSSKIAKECGMEEKLTAELNEKSIESRNVVCASFEVNDAAGNSQRELACFQRKMPISVIESPSHGSRIGSKKLYDGIVVKAKNEMVSAQLPTGKYYSKELLCSEIAAWQARRNDEKATINWMFDVDKARQKMEKL